MQCPQCHNDVPVTAAQFGALYTCPKCVAVYFIGFDGQPEYGSMELPMVEPTDESAEDVPSVDSPVTDTIETHFNLNDDFNSQFSVALESEEPRAANLSFASAAQEIVDYGNQEELISSISYDVKIQGLDTKEVMLAFKDAIEDSKFAWLTQDILNQIKNGETTLKNLNPIQAFVLASRIQFLDLDIDWKQNVSF